MQLSQDCENFTIHYDLYTVDPRLHCRLMDTHSDLQLCSSCRRRWVHILLLCHLIEQSEKTNQTDHTDHSLVYLNETEPCHLEPPKTDGSWWRVLTKQGSLEKGITSHFSILPLRTSWTVWKGKKIGHWKMNSPGQWCPICYWKRVEY